MYNFDELTDDDLREGIMEELHKDYPDAERYHAYMEELERRTPKIELTPEQRKRLLAQHPLVLRRKAKRKRIMKIAVAAMLAVVLVGFLPRAFGAPTLFETVGKWTKETFSFHEGQPEETVVDTEHSGLQELEDKLTELGVTEKVVPTWLPEDYTLKKIDQQSAPTGITVHAIFENAGQEIQISIRVCSEGSVGDYQIDNEIVETCEISGVTTHFVSNVDRYSAIWQTGNVECSIYAETIDELKQIVKSVY